MSQHHHRLVLKAYHEVPFLQPKPIFAIIRKDETKQFE